MLCFHPRSKPKGNVENQSGIIVMVGKYQECLRFYRDKLGLEVLMEKPGITQFRLGSLYLQIEDSEALQAEPTRNVILRQDVASVSRKQEELSGRGIELEIHDLDWGEIGIGFDPDGNKVEYFRKK